MQHLVKVAVLTEIVVEAGVEIGRLGFVVEDVG